MDVVEAVKTIKKHCENQNHNCNGCKIEVWCNCDENAIYTCPEDWEIKENKSTKRKTRGFERVGYAPADVKLPTRSTKHSAGYDFFAPCDILVPAHGTSEIVQSGIKAYMQPDEVLFVYIRSSMAVKKNIMLANNVGVIDSDYYNNVDNEGNIGFKFVNNSDTLYVIRKGDKMAQGIFCKYYVADDDNAVGTRTGGVGSTGK